HFREPRHSNQIPSAQPMPDLPLLPTTLVGSYPQPDWLVDREALFNAGVPRVPVPHIWRGAPELLTQAQDDAPAGAIHDQEAAGIDIITDGEIRRESYSNKFANALSGVDPVNKGHVSGRVGGRGVPVPLFSSAVRRTHGVEIDDVTFLRNHTSKLIKATLPGP